MAWEDYFTFQTVPVHRTCDFFWDVVQPRKCNLWYPYLTKIRECKRLCPCYLQDVCWLNVRGDQATGMFVFQLLLAGMICHQKLLLKYACDTCTKYMAIPKIWSNLVVGDSDTGRVGHPHFDPLVKPSLCTTMFRSKTLVECRCGGTLYNW